MKKPARTPQQKKRLSYAKDRRNAYGENSKSSRKNIPRSKALDVRRQRHEQDQALRSVRVAGSEDQQVAAELGVLTAKPRQWVKQPDVSLAEHLVRKARRRAKV
jgi:hypothetical protein